MQRRPISDLLNNFSEIQNIISGDSPVFLMKDGKDAMVVMSPQQYSDLCDPELQQLLDETDLAAATTGKRLAFCDVFGCLEEELQ